MDMSEHDRYYAHSYDGGSAQSDRWQLLRDHLRNVAELARAFAKDARPNDPHFVAAAEWAGLLHDLGKYRPEFQEYLRRRRTGSPETHHAVYGAAAAADACGSTAATFAVAGHHAGLHNLEGLQKMIRRYGAAEAWPALLETWKNDMGRSHVEQLPDEPDPLRCDVTIRMLFSLLVDADRIDAAACSGPRPTAGSPLRAGALLERLALHVQELQRQSVPGELAQLRARILQEATQKATERQGFFTLTVPTGGGKTLASLAFALKHARQYELRRVIFVIPYLSIIEQNAKVYRDVLGDDVVVEHHSSIVVPEEEHEVEPRECSPLSLATENWDAPVIVTTSIQFIETLFASSPCACRRLHNVARSVVVFDEAQTLPGHLLNPTISILRELVASYRVSIVFCSATQPGFRRTLRFAEGLSPDEAIEIAPVPADTFRRLRRVQYHLPTADERLTWAQLAERVAEHQQVLVVVNTRRAAFDLWQALRQRLPDEAESVFHLSSAMCAEHRMASLGRRDKPAAGTIHHRLSHGAPCRVVSTQLIEAGVDIDFPVVYRAMGPLDGIVQAAGRCNREGRLPRLGDVHVFIPAEPGLPPGPYTTATSQTAAILDGLRDPDRLATDPALYAEYFNSLYGELLPTDHARQGEHTIQQNREKKNFRTVAENAKVIKDDTTAVVVLYGKAKEIVAEIRRKQRVDREDLRRLQRYMVNVRGSPGGCRRSDFFDLLNMRLVDRLLPNVDLWVLDANNYHESLGIVIKQRPAEDLVV